MVGRLLMIRLWATSNPGSVESPQQPLAILDDWEKIGFGCSRTRMEFSDVHLPSILILL